MHSKFIGLFEKEHTVKTNELILGKCRSVLCTLGEKDTKNNPCSCT